MKKIKEIFISHFPQIADLEWRRNVISRAVRTFFQSLAASFTVYIGEIVAVGEVQWGHIFATALAAMIYSIATSVVVGLPDNTQKEEENTNEETEEEEEV